MPTSRDHMVVVFESGVKYHKPQNQTFTYNYEAIKIQGFCVRDIDFASF
jgi:hypothetical protein